MKIFGLEIKLFKEPSKTGMTKELGASGTTFFGGQVASEEYITELTGSAALTTYDKMRKSDGVVKASLMACELPVRAANWYIQPASDEESDIEVADFVSENLFKGMSITWDDFLRQALLCLPFGFYVFEKVFQPIDYNGKEMIGWRKFAARMPKTIYSWKTEAGEDGITQLLPTGERISIPISKLLVFTHQKEGEDWNGISVLRSAYRPWFFKNHIEKVNAIAFERQGAGLPYGKLPRNASQEDRDTMEELLKNIRANEQGYLIQPDDWEIEFKDMKMGTSREPDETIRRYNREILISVLAQFLDLGSGGTGSRALSADHSTTFHNNLIALAKTVQDIINKYAIKQLVDLNYTVSEYPTLEYSYIGMPKYADLATALTGLIEKGAITPDERLEEHLRQIMDLPEKSEEEEVEEEPETKEPKTDELEEEKEEFQEMKMSEFVPFRKLTFAEKKVDFRDIKKKIENETDKLRKELSGIMKKITTDLIRQFEMVLEAPSNKEKRERVAKLKVKYQDEYRKALYHSIIDMYQYGKMIAAHEMKKEVPATPAKALSIMSSLADSLTEMMADDLMKEGKLKLLVELQKKQFTFSEALNRIMGGVKKAGDSIVLNASAINVGNALNQGRRTSFIAYKDDVYALQRSELLDDRTCDYCMSIDGRTFRKSDSFTTVDLIHSHCRGLWVEILKTEEEKPAIDGMPKTLRERFYGINSFNPPTHPIVRKDSLAGKFVEERRITKELDILYPKASIAKKEIDTLIDGIVAKNKDSIAVKAPLKGKKRALEKVVTELKGNVGHLTDVARNSIVTKDKKQLEGIFNELKGMPNVVRSISVDDIKMGYQGAMIKIRTSNGITAEIQIITDKMFYAKDSVTFTKEVLGAKRFFEKTFSEIKKAAGGVEGGLGHIYYESWRVMPKKNMRYQMRILEQKSRDYYLHFK